MINRDQEKGLTIITEHELFTKSKILKINLMTEISSMLMDISLFGYYQMFTFANIGPVLDSTVSFKNLINKTRSNK
jgi:hypothetical protein